MSCCIRCGEVILKTTLRYYFFLCRFKLYLTKPKNLYILLINLTLGAKRMKKGLVMVVAALAVVAMEKGGEKKKDIWDIDLGDIKVDKELTKGVAGKYRGSVRLALGLICTKEEFEEEKRRVLNRPLP